MILTVFVPGFIPTIWAELCESNVSVSCVHDYILGHCTYFWLHSFLEPSHFISNDSSLLWYKKKRKKRKKRKKKIFFANIFHSFVGHSYNSDNFVWCRFLLFWLLFFPWLWFSLYMYFSFVLCIPTFFTKCVLLFFFSFLLYFSLCFDGMHSALKLQLESRTTQEVRKKRKKYIF